MPLRPRPLTFLPRRQRGLSLLDALLAALVLSVGLLGAARLIPEVQRAAEAARQRSEALRFAQEALEQLRAQATPPVSHAARDLAAHGALGSTAAFTIEQAVTAQPIGLAVTLRVRWTDRDGRPRALALSTLHPAADDAVQAGMLAMRR